MSLGASLLYLFIPGSEWKLVAHEEGCQPSHCILSASSSCVNMTHELTLQSKTGVAVLALQPTASTPISGAELGDTEPNIRAALLPGPFPMSSKH